MRSYEKIGDEVIIGIGGKENVDTLSHCYTRLRFRIKDNSKIDLEHLENIKGIIRVINSAGQLQIVIGNEVVKVYDYLAEKYNLGSSTQNVEEDKAIPGKKGFKYYGQQVLNAISSILTPVIGGLVMTGLFLALLTLLSVTNIIDADSQTYQLLYMMGDSLFYFMPFLVAYSASRYFKSSTILSLILAGILMHPTLFELVEAGDQISLLGIPVQLITYNASLLPILFTVWIQSLVERFFSKTFFNKLGLLSMFPVFLVMAPLTLLATGPFGYLVGGVIAEGAIFVYDQVPAVGVFAICFLMPFFIWTGSHWVLFPVAFSNMATLGFDPFLWIGFTAWNFSQLGVSTAFFFKTKNKDLKSIAGSAAISVATAGISEPAAYGITLKMKKPIIPSFIGTGIGGLFFGLLSVKVYQLVNVSVISLPQFIDPSGGNNLLLALIGIILVFSVTFVLTWFFGIDESAYSSKDLKEQKAS